MPIHEGGFGLRVVTRTLEEATALYTLLYNLQEKDDDFVLDEDEVTGIAAIYLMSDNTHGHAVEITYQTAPVAFMQGLWNRLTIRRTSLPKTKYVVSEWGWLSLDIWCDTEKEVDSVGDIMLTFPEVWGVDLENEQVELYYDRGGVFPAPDGGGDAQAVFMYNGEDESALFNVVIDYIMKYASK